MRPDGDAIGSQLALGYALRAAGKEVRLINEDGLPEDLTFMRGSELIEKPPAGPVNVDLVVALDTATKARVGEKVMAALTGCARWVNIDHHKSNPNYGELNYIDSDSPATGQIIYQLIKEMGLSMPDETRDAIYVAISTDTGSFQYDRTTAETYEIAADLIRHGLAVGEINAEIYDSYPFRRLELMRVLLNSLKLTNQGQVSYWELTQETVKDLDLRPKDSEGLIDTIRAIKGVKVAIFFEELGLNSIRVSMRSKDSQIDVSEICQTFGGGGHSLAAGIRMDGSLSDCREQVLAVVAKSF